VIRVVIDTGVLIRYLIRPSAAVKELIEVRWFADQVRMVSAPELTKELEGVLARDHIQALIRPGSIRQCPAEGNSIHQPAGDAVVVDLLRELGYEPVPINP
jgi:predicted nucleic acid-binding protein